MIYRLVRGYSANYLSEKVNNALGRGWVLYGNPIHAPEHGAEGDQGFCQAMLKG